MMKKSKNDAEGALFSPLKTTDDDDDDDVELDCGPAPRYRDDPQSSSGDTTPSRSSSSADDGGPAIRYRDEPDSSIFDWNDSDDNNNGRDKKKKQELWDSLQKPDNVDNIGDVYQIDNEFDTDANGFSPVSLHDDDDDSDDEEVGSGRKVRVKANNLLNQRVFDDTTYDDENERIFVGGGWGRQGSSDRMWFSWCCRRATPTYSRGRKEGYSTCQIAFLIMTFLALVFASGFVGYEAGLPVDVENNDSSGDVYEPPLHPHTKGEEWLEWIEHEKDEIHLPHFNMTFHKPHLKPKKDKDDEKTPRFEPMTQPALLKLSENIFQSCSERSLKTAAGRNACLSLCHGRYCCFEKEKEFGSCVAETNSYCFAYAACENVITDFEMNNANTVSKGHEMNEDDVALLTNTCSKENIATLDGIRDCTAFCQHHLCCFNELESENCKVDHPGECAVYDVCKILVYGPDGKMEGGGVESISAGKSNDTPIDNTQTFKSLCSADNIEFNRDVCKNHCARYECCFSAKDSCYAKQKLECDEYYICEEFYMDYNDLPGPEQDDMEMYGQDQPETSPFVADMDIISAVNSVCGVGSNNQADDSWVSACHSLCANYLCCFATEGTRSNCRGSVGEEMCNAYQGCNVLHITYVTDSEGNVLEQDAEGNVFVASTESPLDKYDWTATTAAPSLPKALGGGGQKTAAALEELEEKELNEVYEACIPKARRDPWLADRCRKACDVRGCCFDEGPGNCYGMNTAWCDEFQSCQDVLYD